MPERKHKRVLGYARVSSLEQAIGTSLQDQQDSIRAYARSLGLEVTKMYIEAASAVHEKFERREKIQALLSDAKAGDLVLCHVLDRWSRDPEFTYRSTRELLAKGASFYAVSDRVDPSTSEGDTALGFRVLFAREEHKRIKQRTVGTRKLLRDRGYYADGLPPVGYRRQDVRGPERNALVVDAEGASRVREVFRMCIAGRSLVEIASAIGVTRDFAADTLANRVYLGEVRDARGEWIRGRHEAIIDARTFTLARESLGRRRFGERKSRDGSHTSSWWLRDLARCGHCSAKMSAAYAGPLERRRYYYRCFRRCVPKYVPVRLVEEQAEPIVIARLEELRERIASARHGDPTAPVVDVVTRLARIEAKRSRIVDAFADGAFDRAELRRRLEAIDLERTKAQAEGQVAPRATASARRAAVAVVGRMAAAFRAATPAERRLIVGAIARSAAIVDGQPPKFEWIEAEELALRANGGRT